MIKSLFIVFLLFVMYSSIHTFSISDYHCEGRTCRDFYYGLKHYPRRDQYKEICSHTVSALQAIPRKHGKCIDDKTGKMNAPCLYALAETIKSCMIGLYDVTNKEARFFCGYTLMKYCAEDIGLEGLPLNFQY